jgi:hypothetical protein
MGEAQRLTLQSNPLRFGRYLERNQDPQQEHAGALHKLPSDFYLYRPFKMVADLSYDSEAPISLHGIVSRGDFSQVQIVVTNTGTEDFALVDMSKLTFTVEQFHSMPKRGGPYNMTMLQNYYQHAITVSPTSGTSDEEDSHSDNNEAMETA